MCSVFGYIGNQYSRNLVLKGLQKLEYRGYDSAGFACLEEHSQQLKFAKAQGSLDKLELAFRDNPIDGYCGIGHTRWATHGGFSLENAHPHFDCTKSIALIHNGIIENHAQLRAQLVQQGHTFHSQTDTEVVAHLFERLVTQSSLSIELLADIIGQLEGAYAIVALMQAFPSTMIVARKRSPLCIGIADQSLFVASDPLAFADHTNRVIFLPEDSFGVLHQDRFQIYNAQGQPITVEPKEVLTDASLLDKKGYDHFMLKEMYEQKNGIYATVSHLQATADTYLQQLGLTHQQLIDLQLLSLIGCGTSYYAGRIAQFFFEEIARIQTTVHLASEMRYMPFFAQKNSLYCAISQSGETADTLEALRMIQQHGMHTVALTNVASSSMVRQADGYLLTKAGQEVAVASTKAFVTQVAALYWLACKCAHSKGLLNDQQLEDRLTQLYLTAEIIEQTMLNYADEIKRVFAPHYAHYDRALFLGRHISFPLAMEAALKLKEIAYVFAQAYPAGELKHGPLALIEPNTPVFVFSHQDPLIYSKLVSNVQEIKARKGHVVAFAFEGQDELIHLADSHFVFPQVDPLLGPLAQVGVMQYCVYEIALFLQRPIDKPRNLAKSVTVE